MASYRRVTYEDRCQIYALFQVSIGIVEIARKLQFHRTTIFRELKRNTFFKYVPKAAQAASEVRFLRCRRKRLIQGELENQVRSALERGWSPEQISGRFRRERICTISPQCIYNYIRRHWGTLRIYLRNCGRRGAGRRRQKRTRLTQNKRWISDRPKVANARKRTGDWERDTMYCANRKLVLVCTDRKSRYTRLTKLKSYEIKHASKQTMALLKSAHHKIHTITNDNGPEFRDGPNMPIAVYYCHPRRAYQRGTVENTIGLLRQYIKRTTLCEQLTRKRLKQIENHINLRPKRCLDYRTPFEVFYRTRVALVS